MTKTLTKIKRIAEGIFIMLFIVSLLIFKSAVVVVTLYCIFGLLKAEVPFITRFLIILGGMVWMIKDIAKLLFYKEVQSK